MRPLPRPAVRSGVVALVAIAALVGCTTSRTACDSGGCTVELSGKQTVEVDLGSFERAVDVEVISAGAVVVALGWRGGRGAGRAGHRGRGRAGAARRAGRRRRDAAHHPGRVRTRPASRRSHGRRSSS